MAHLAQQLDLVDEIDLDLARACIRLGSARTALAGKDSPANRGAVAAARAEVDRLLDLRNAAAA
ncbi:hypothetical protein [Blastococcus sp. SYSU D00813]